MKLTIGGEEQIRASVEELWAALNDPDVLARCIPGCNAMRETGPDQYRVEMQLKVAAVGGTFEGNIALSDKDAPRSCRIAVDGSGTLGHGKGAAKFELGAGEDGMSRLSYEGTGEVGGLVAGVGQRILSSVSKHLIKRFFTTLKGELENSSAKVAVSQ